MPGAAPIARLHPKHRIEQPAMEPGGVHRDGGTGRRLRLLCLFLAAMEPGGVRRDELRA